MRRDLPTGTVTFVFTDIEGSTRMLDELGAEAYGALLARHHEVCRAAWAAHGGVEVDTAGDAFFVAFPTASGAMAAAAEAQAALDELGLRVRMGVHTGEVTLGETGYVGFEVHRAARIAAAAHGGQVVVSGAAAAEAGAAELLDLGEHRLKDVDEPVAIHQLGGESFPPLKTLSNTNLPRPASSFVGRDVELTDVLSRFGSGARLVTLTGPGGTGKTRLAIEAGSSLVPDVKAGVFWVGLATLRDPALVTETIVQTLGAKGELAAHVGEREMLLVLDNFEQVIEAAPELSALLRSCPKLRLLVTSRELLRVDGEVEYPVPPLAHPEAVTLFCERARWAPGDEIRELCLRLDNLPLAVELAAARTKGLSPAQIHERLSQRLDLLKGGRDAEPRQQTLRATIEWSYELLSEEEQRLFRALSAFSGGCTLEAAEEVADADVDTLQSLVEKSLVRFANDRYWMLETIRQYAADGFREDDRAGRTHQRHADHFVQLADDAEDGVRTELRPVWLDRLEVESANLRAALEWLEMAGQRDRALRMAGALYRFWLTRGHYEEGRRTLERLIPPGDEEASLDVYAALIALGDIGRHQHDVELAESCAERMIGIARARGDVNRECRALAALATLPLLQADFGSAAKRCLEALELAERVGDERLISLSLGNLAYAFLGVGDYEGAKDAAERAVAVSRNPEPDPVDLINLAVAEQGLDNLDAACTAGEQALETAWRYRDFLLTSYGVDFAGSIALGRGEPGVATTLYAAADQLRETAGVPAEPVEAMLAARTREAARSALGAARSDELVREGRALEIAEGVAIGLRVLRDAAGAPSAPSLLRD
jgi:predicted ATPase/class 3 adenylate cyclase